MLFQKVQVQRKTDTTAPMSSASACVVCSSPLLCLLCQRHLVLHPVRTGYIGAGTSEAEQYYTTKSLKQGGADTVWSAILYAIAQNSGIKESRRHGTCGVCQHACCVLLLPALAPLSFAWCTKPALQGWNLAQGHPEHLVNRVQYIWVRLEYGKSSHLRNSHFADVLHCIVCQPGTIGSCNLNSAACTAYVTV